MNANRTTQLRYRLPLVAAAAALAVVVGQVQPWAAADDAEPEGRIVEISPDTDTADRDADPAAAEAPEEQAVEAPAYWIGIQGGPITSALLRTHLQLADGVGIVVADVLPDSPAAKAGLRKHDILIGVGGEQIPDMRVLQTAVAESDAQPIELKVIRLAKEMTVAVTPEDRPADLAAMAQPNVQPRQFGAGIDGLEGLEGLGPEVGAIFEQLRQGGVRLRVPGAVLDAQQFNLKDLPGGTSISVAREGDGPAKFTVKQGDQTWMFESDDEKAISMLPDDVRPLVEQMLHGGQRFASPEFKGRLLKVLPQAIEGLENLEGGNEQIDAAHDQLLKRMQDLEKQMNEFERKVREGLPAEGESPVDEQGRSIEEDVPVEDRST